MAQNHQMSAVTVYIDEAGDPGVRDGLKFVGSRHEWMCVSAVVVRTANAGNAVQWIDACMSEANARQSRALHYHRINRERRQNVCASLAQSPCRTFTVASHKTNLREYVNPRLRKMIESGKFYNWCMRLLLERVTAWVEAWHLRTYSAIEPMDVIFADRGHDWQHFFSYVDKLEMQKRTRTLFLKGPGLHHKLLDRSSWKVIKAEKHAGLQCADIVASAFYQAANSASPAFDIGPAQALRPIVAEADGIRRNVGLTVFPLPRQAAIPDDAKPIFQHYGYQF